MTRQEKEDLLREAVEILIKLDNHMMTSRDNAEFSQWVEDLIEDKEPKTDTLDRIKAEMHETAEKHEDGDWYLREEWVVEIIDKYKAESEDKE